MPWPQKLGLHRLSSWHVPGTGGQHIYAAPRRVLRKLGWSSDGICNRLQSEEHRVMSVRS
eukprot:10732031-Karenia_brevis.AAC.1